MESESDKHFNNILELIDRKLALTNVPVNQRTLSATIDFVTNYVLDVKGEEGELSKDDFHDKVWFKSLYKQVRSWYCLRYGESFSSSTTSTSIGVISLYGTPFEVSVPLFVRTSVEKEGESAWFTIPTTILPEEDVIDWLTSPPNLDSLNPNVIDAIYGDLSHVGTSLRSIHVNLMTADKSGGKADGMISGVSSHLHNAAKDILSSGRDGVTYAYWELHLAVEKVIKVFLSQHGSQYPHSHKLHNLFDQARNEYGLQINNDKLNKMPSSKEAISYRYGEKSGTTNEYAISVYKEVLDIVCDIAQALKRKYTMDNASFLIQRPQWERE